MDAERDLFTEAEQQMRLFAGRDLPTLPLADKASHLLALTLKQIELPAPADDPDDEYVKRHAALVLGIIGARSLRSITVLLRNGYDMEAYVFQRRMDEAWGRMDRYLHTEDGPARARAWQAGWDGKPNATVGDKHYYKGLSFTAHADMRAVTNHLTQPRGDGLSSYIVLPKRNAAMGNASIVHAAFKAFFMADAVSRLLGGPALGDHPLLAELLDAFKRWIEEPYDEQRERAVQVED